MQELQEEIIEVEAVEVFTPAVRNQIEPVSTKEYKQLFAAYGTLRLGQGNYNWCLRGCSDYLGTMQTEPTYTMYSLGGFPAVAEGGDTAITVDIFGVDDEDTIDNVNGLEGHVCKNHPRNWYNTTTISTPYGDAEMFIMNEMHQRGMSPVVSGDWLNR